MNLLRTSQIFLFILLAKQFACMNGFCREKRFTNFVPGFVISNHVMGEFDVTDMEHCQLKCYLEKSCFSYNFGPVNAEHVYYKCELNNADSTSHPADLIARQGWLYQKAEVLCGDKVCPSYAVCRYDSLEDRDRCICKPGVIREDCEALGMKQNSAVKTCKQLKLLVPSSSTGVYWITPNGGTDENAFQAYCDMETDGGGWTLVYSYTFTNYKDFMAKSNAITPRPGWPEQSNTVPLSETAPLNETDFAAMSFTFWRLIGSEVLIKSNINNWVACLSREGSLVEWRPGSVDCRVIQHVTQLCPDVVPAYVQLGKCGVKFRRLRADWTTNYYSLSACTGRQQPEHDPCGTSKDNHLKGVQNPHGNVFIR